MPSKVHCMGMGCHDRSYPQNCFCACAGCSTAACVTVVRLQEPNLRDQLETVVAERASLAAELHVTKARLAKAIALLERASPAFAACSYAFLREVKELLDES